MLSRRRQALKKATVPVGARACWRHGSHLSVSKRSFVALFDRVQDGAWPAGHVDRAVAALNGMPLAERGIFGARVFVKSLWVCRRRFSSVPQRTFSCAAVASGREPSGPSRAASLAVANSWPWHGASGSPAPPQSTTGSGRLLYRPRTCQDFTSIQGRSPSENARRLRSPTACVCQTSTRSSMRPELADRTVRSGM